MPPGSTVSGPIWRNILVWLYWGMALTQADPGLVRLARLHGRAWEEWNVELQREANRLTAAWIDALARARDPGRLRAVDHWFRV